MGPPREETQDSLKQFAFLAGMGDIFGMLVCNWDQSQLHAIRNPNYPPCLDYALIKRNWTLIMMDLQEKNQLSLRQLRTCDLPY